MKTESDEFLPTRESLLNRLRNWEDQTSWNHFFETYWRLIYSVGRRAGLNDAEAQDVVQETMMTVAKKLPGFQYDPRIGSFKAWLLTLTRSRIHDHLRKKIYHRNGEPVPREEPLGTSLLEVQPAPEAPDLQQVWEEEWSQNLMNKAVEEVKLKVPARIYQMFYLHGLKAIPARDVAQRLNATVAEVYFAKYKVSGLLRKEIKVMERSLG